MNIKLRFYHKLQNNLRNFSLIDKFSIEFLKNENGWVFKWVLQISQAPNKESTDSS